MTLVYKISIRFIYFAKYNVSPVAGKPCPSGRNKGDKSATYWYCSIYQWGRCWSNCSSCYYCWRWWRDCCTVHFQCCCSQSKLEVTLCFCTNGEIQILVILVFYLHYSYQYYIFVLCICSHRFSPYGCLFPIVIQIPPRYCWTNFLLKWGEKNSIVVF